MPPIVSKLKGKILHSQTREVIYNVLLTFMEVEARNKEPSIPIKNAQLRSAEATGVSRTAVQKIKREGNKPDVAKGTSFSTPNKKGRKHRNTN